MALSSTLIDVEIQDLKRIEKDVYALKTSDGRINIHGQRIVANETNEAKRVFKDEIQRRVYSVPPTDYNRTGDLGRGVKSASFSMGMAAGKIFIDPNIVGKNKYFYPLSVEFGLESKPAYWARFYFRNATIKTRAEFRRRMRLYMEEAKLKLMNK